MNFLSIFSILISPIKRRIHLSVIHLRSYFTIPYFTKNPENEMLKSKRKRGRRNSLMANNFSKELDRVIVTATLYRPSFTNPFEKRHGIAAKRVARVHGANLAWTIGGGRSITETAIRIHRVDPWSLRLRRRCIARAVQRGITLASVGESGPDR